jgi:hypothetical protein
VTFEHEGNFYIANLKIYYIAIVNATEPKNNVDYDGCIYHKITDVILEEDSEKLIFLEMYTSGTPTSPGQNCDGGEFTVTFQTLGENAISMIIDYGEDFGSDTFTLIKSSSTFSSNNCSNANSSGYLLLF